ncbi:MAG: hypothetical protein ACTSUO_06690 [Candidatus Thorarchaeota archaeon]
MKKYSVIAVFVVVGLLATATAAAPTDYNQVLVPSLGGNTAITWNVIESPNVPVAWGWTGEGSWFIEEGGTISFTISEIHTDVEGSLRIGNFTTDVNNTDTARELVLGVWGLTEFFPGFVVPVGESNLENLNITAYASALRVQGNYMNGTMESSFEEITIGSTAYDCVVFNYTQDSSGFGEPQRTVLAYDTITGVLVTANTSFFFGVPYSPYSLVVELSSVVQTGVVLSTIIIASIVVLVIIFVVVKRK